jgi:hypothetical protein
MGALDWVIIAFIVFVFVNGHSQTYLQMLETVNKEGSFA